MSDCFLFFDLANPGDGSRVTWKSYLRFCRSQGEPPPQPPTGILMVSGTLSKAEMNSLREAWAGNNNNSVMINASATYVIATNTRNATFNWTVTTA